MTPSQKICRCWRTFRLKDKLHARITADEAAQLKAHLAADGYDTVQDWLTDVVRGYISKGDRE